MCVTAIWQELREADVRYAEWLPPGHNDEEDAKELSTMLEGLTSAAICTVALDEYYETPNPIGP